MPITRKDLLQRMTQEELLSYPDEAVDAAILAASGQFAARTRARYGGSIPDELPNDAKYAIAVAACYHLVKRPGFDPQGADRLWVLDYQQALEDMDRHGYPVPSVEGGCDRGWFDDDDERV